MCSEEVPDLVKELEQSFAAEIRKEVWGTLPPINHMSCLKVRNSYLRPSILGPEGDLPAAQGAADGRLDDRHRELQG